MLVSTSVSMSKSQCGCWAGELTDCLAGYVPYNVGPLAFQKAQAHNNSNTMHMCASVCYVMDVQMGMVVTRKRR